LIEIQPSDRLFRLFAAFWGIAALYHFVGTFLPINQDPVWRHALFTGINLLFGYGLLKRPRYFTSAFLIFMVQQFGSHGNKILARWQQEGRLDLISLLVLLILPLVYYFLWKERKIKKSASPLSDPNAQIRKQGTGLFYL
jgi:hypothetical protein